MVSLWSHIWSDMDAPIVEWIGPISLMHNATADALCITCNLNITDVDSNVQITTKIARITGTDRVLVSSVSASAPAGTVFQVNVTVTDASRNTEERSFTIAVTSPASARTFDPLSDSNKTWFFPAVVAAGVLLVLFCCCLAKRRERKRAPPAASQPVTSFVNPVSDVSPRLWRRYSGTRKAWSEDDNGGSAGYLDTRELQTNAIMCLLTHF